MKYYTIQDNGLLIADNEQSLIRFYENVLPLPIDYKQDKYIVLNNELVLNPKWDEIELQNIKEEKIAENNSKRDEALNGGVLYKDVLFDSDTDQKVNLLATVSSIDDEQTIVWYGMDNQPLTCTKEDLINIGGLITSLHSFCWNKNAEIKMEIADCLTVDEVKAIEINYEQAEEREVE